MQRSSESSFGYQPALDGLRAVSIAAVLAFHLGAPWMPGGYLGVSVFFTLSGFLITSLLLDEHRRTGRIAPGAFYVRRLRRLLPAASICLAAVAALAAAGAFGQRGDLRGGILAAGLHVANWESLLAGRSYAELFAAPSPVAHFWSLAVEEQFYWIWPLAMMAIVGVAARRRDPHRWIAASIGALFALFAASAVLTARWWGPEAAYLASWARFAEILAGAALAAAITGRSMPARGRWLGPPALAIVAVLCVASPSGSGWAYEGALPAFALVSAALIVGVQSDGPLRRALAWDPLVWIGRISYGLYLVHWPVIVLLDQQRTGLDGPALAALRLAITFAITAVSFHLVEHPIRVGRILPRPQAFVTASAGAAAAVVVLALVAVPVSAPAPAEAPRVLGVSTPAPLAMEGAAASALAGTGSDEAALSPAPPPRPPTVAVFGDSIPAWLLRDAAAGFARTDVAIVNGAQEACDGIAEHPPVRDRHGKHLAPPDTCLGWPDAYPAILEDPAAPVDVAVVFVGQLPGLDAQVEGEWLHPCVDMTWYLDDVRARVGYVRAHVDRVVLVLPALAERHATWMLADDHEERFSCVRDQLDRLGRRLAVEILDPAPILCPTHLDGSCPPLRELDGRHVDPEDALLVLEWILDRVDPHRPSATEHWPLRASMI